MTQLTISAARKGFLSLPATLARVPERALTITRHGEPVMGVMSSDLFESIIETLDILSDVEATAALRESIEDLKRGRLVDHTAVGRRLGR
jgi:PHD/YefM family antitoxin component YafN of YafNO toxin-antitoxin module